LGVVVAAAGYPTAPRKGDVITGLPVDAPETMVFQASTALNEQGGVAVAGGRVLCITALADSVVQARDRAYAVLDGIHFDGMLYRRDIGHRAL
jgi:phosphoribosylamine--glycine ligase